MPLKDHRTGRQDILKIAPPLLSVDAAYNVRKINVKEPDFLELKESIRANGVREPLTVRTAQVDGVETYYVVAGHRRFTAVKELIAEGVEIAALPVRAVKMNAEELTLDLVVSNSGKPLNQIEQGEVFKRLTNYGWMPQDIAARTGKSGQHIANCLALFDLPTAAKAKVFAGEVSASTLLEMSKQHGGGEKLVEKVSAAVTTAKASGKTKVTAKTAKEKPEMSGSEFDAIEAFILKACNATNGALAVKVLAKTFQIK